LHIGVQIRSKNYHLHRYIRFQTVFCTSEYAALTSPIFRVNDGMICIQLLIGLCATCDVNITLYDATSHEKLKSFIVESTTLSTTTHGLPTWQFVTIKHLADCNSAIMELRPVRVLISKIFDPLWAVIFGNVPQMVLTQLISYFCAR